MSPAEKEARQMIADRKMQKATDRAYNQSLTNTEMAPAPAPVAPAQKPARPAAVQEAIQEMQDAKDRKKISAMGYKSGGSVSKASKRADGIAQRGKTKGKMI